MTTIRPAEDRDAVALAELLDALGYEAAPVELPQRMQRFRSPGNGAVLVAELDGAVVAFAALEITYPIHHAEPVGHVSAFAVARSARRRGIGQHLLTAVESAARVAGCRRMIVTSAEGRSDAHAFYQAAGWPCTGRRFGKQIE